MCDNPTSRKCTLIQQKPKLINKFCVLIVRSTYHIFTALKTVHQRFCLLALDTIILIVPSINAKTLEQRVFDSFII